MKLSRRETLLGLAALAATAAGGARAATPSLGAAAEGAGILFGSSIAADTLSNPRQAALYLAQSRSFIA